jgi:hypothetical protein
MTQRVYDRLGNQGVVYQQEYALSHGAPTHHSGTESAARFMRRCLFGGQRYRTQRLGRAMGLKHARRFLS